MRILNRILWIACLVLATVSVFAQSGKVLGKLGQALEGSAIYASPNSRARVFYKVQPYEYLIIQSSRKEGWLRVVMENGRYGYIDAGAVARLPYEVTAKDTQPPRNRTTTMASRGGVTASGSGDAREWVSQYALNYIGTPYVWGGTNMDKGVDCSGFVLRMYGKIGIDLPRTAAEQALVGQPINRLEDLQPGDRLYFWSDKRNKIGHTGIYLGNGFFVHSSYSKGQIVTDDLRKEYWRKTLVAARR